MLLWVWKPYNDKMGNIGERQYNCKNWPPEEMMEK